jgi:urease accessory protein
VPIELKPDHLKIEPDHVLADMLRAMHLIVTAVDEAFEPENGAYATGGHHGGHSHGHDHSHTHATPAPSASKLAAIPIATAGAAPHVHGPGCGHNH